MRNLHNPSGAVSAMALLAILASPATASEPGTRTAYDAPVDFELRFVRHIDDNLPEQDVFIERTPGANHVFRPTKAERNLDQPVFAAARPVAHAPFDEEANGPWPKGRSLNLTLGQWLEARGEGRYRCTDGEGVIDATFSGLVPGGTYTMWHYFMAWPPTEPFIGTYDLPLGSRDGEQSVFTADVNGDATFRRIFKPCLQLTGEHLMSGLAVAWHSDGKTYGVSPGDFATSAHIQLYLGLPKRSGI